MFLGQPNERLASFSHLGVSALAYQLHGRVAVLDQGCRSDWARRRNCLVELGYGCFDRQSQTRTLALRIFYDGVKFRGGFVEVRVDHSHSVYISLGNLLVKVQTESVPNARAAGGSCWALTSLSMRLLYQVSILFISIDE